MFDGFLRVLHQPGKSAETSLGQYASSEIVGRPNLEVSNDIETMVLPVRLHAKLRSGSPEHIGQRQKTLHMAMMANLRDKLSRELDLNGQIIGSSEVKRIYGEFDRLI
jgi:hypothetical protein